jgi:endonuclease/exonuclease/phosphatase family metal-dependent hydrolase
MDRKPDPDRICRVIQEMDPDILGLQETDEGFYGRCDGGMIERFARETGRQAVLAPTMWRQNGHYGNALLTRWPVLDVRRLDLSVPGREPRGALDVDLDMGGMAVRVIVAHLGLLAAERREQVRRLRQKLATETGAVEIMMGDINEWFPRRRLLRCLHNHFGKIPSRRTFPSLLPLLSLDKIWVKPRQALVETGVHVSALSRIASDHLPVRAVVRFQAEPSGEEAEGGRWTARTRSREAAA